MVSLPHFEYIRPKNLKEAILVLGKKSGAKVLAGGTDILVQMKKGLVCPTLLVDIKSIPKLNLIFLNSRGELVLGAAVTLDELVQWTKMREDWFGLSIAAGCIGSEQVRNRGTVVGNVCRASPAGDMAPVIIALDGKVEIHGLKGKRYVPVENFITGPGQTVLTQGEMVTSLKIPKSQANTASIYLKLGARRAMDTAVVSVAVRITLDKALKRIVLARIVLGAVAPTPIRVPEAEEILKKNGVTPMALEEICRIVVERIKPITDLRATESYRSQMVEVLIKRAINQTLKRVTQRRWFNEKD